MTGLDTTSQETGLSLPASRPMHTLGAAGAIPFRLSVSIPLPGLKLRDLRALRVGQIFETPVFAAEDVPACAGGLTIAWAELDNVEGHMAVRITRLA